MSLSTVGKDQNGVQHLKGREPAPVQRASLETVGKDENVFTRFGILHPYQHPIPDRELDPTLLVAVLHRARAATHACRILSHMHAGTRSLTDAVSSNAIDARARPHRLSSLDRDMR